MFGVKFKVLEKLKRNIDGMVGVTIYDHLLSADIECKCSGDYKIDGRDIPAYCGRWAHLAYDWCYLWGGLNAKSCPGAKKSVNGDFYWTEHFSVCKGRNFMTAQSVCFLSLKTQIFIIPNTLLSVEVGSP